MIKFKVQTGRLTGKFHPWWQALGGLHPSNDDPSVSLLAKRAGTSEGKTDGAEEVIPPAPPAVQKVLPKSKALEQRPTRDAEDVVSAGGVVPTAGTPGVVNIRAKGNICVYDKDGNIVGDPSQCIPPNYFDLKEAKQKLQHLKDAAANAASSEDKRQNLRPLPSSLSISELSYLGNAIERQIQWNKRCSNVLIEYLKACRQRQKSLTADFNSKSAISFKDLVERQVPRNE